MGGDDQLSRSSRNFGKGREVAGRADFHADFDGFAGLAANLPWGYDRPSRKPPGGVAQLVRAQDS